MVTFVGRVGEKRKIVADGEHMEGIPVLQENRESTLRHRLLFLAAILDLPIWYLTGKTDCNNLEANLNLTDVGDGRVSRRKNEAKQWSNLS